MNKVEQYLNRIGITPRLTNPRDLLQEIHYRHFLTVPFENLDIVHFQKPLSMNPEIVWEKVVHNHRGGLCFETNSLSYYVLTELGYQVDFISGGFWNDVDQKWAPPYSHLALLVTLADELYLYDVGVGGGPVYPLQLKEGYLQHDPTGTYQITQSKQDPSNWYTIEQKTEKGWTRKFGVSTFSCKLENFHDSLIQIQTDPNSIFRQNKLVSKNTEDGRISLTNDFLTVTKDGIKIKEPIYNEKEWSRILWEYFGIKA
ncbi:arylamine N-acetyltransferase family protein [Risungbinella massiliensis]|uniref:arylamine N-acetyltransferase family protein n=1 Tax=Risungbinella massiliensis TaxID=1329796 RepID=UPI000699465B|nr:arylamine N-acetyltransferase [Risungbinella massiliensis]